MRRSLVAGVLAGAACLAMVVSVLAFATHRLLLDTDTWVQNASELQADPEVRAAVADALTNWTFEALDVKGRVEALAPGPLGGLAGQLEPLARQQVSDQVDRVLGTDTFARFWVQANEVAHRNAVAVLRGENDQVYLVDGNVVIDLVPIIADVLRGVTGALPAALGLPQIPPIGGDQTPTEEIDALGTALGLDLPAGFGQLTVAHSDDLARAADAVRAFDLLVPISAVVALALSAGAVAAAARRVRMVAILALGLVLAVAVSVAATALVRAHAVSLVDTTPGSLALSSLATASLRSLQGLIVVVALVGLAAAVVLVAGMIRDRREPGPA